MVKILIDGVEEDWFVDVAYNVARYHHERWDGKGYPEGLVGNMIPLEARIMAVADVYDALVSERCYKKAMSFEEALEEIEQIKAATREEIDEIKNDARKEGYEAGYAEGLDAAKAEYEERCKELENQRNGLEEEYQTLVSELEPKIVDVITDVYTHVFGDSFFNHRDVMVSLISKALSGVSADDNVVIHVSSEDYDMLLGMKQQLFSRVSLMREPEIISEDRLKAGEAKVETAYGIMDCGIDTELKELSRILHVLSYEGHDQC